VSAPAGRDGGARGRGERSAVRGGAEGLPVLVVKCGSTLASLRERRGDYEDWILAGMGVPRARAQVASAPDEDALPDPASVAAVVLTGSSAMVSAREPWSERAAGWLRGAVRAGTPVLGICYGHQLLAHALGGRVGVNPRGREIGTVLVETGPAARADALLGELPERFPAQATHVESVLELPAGATLLAASQGDPHQAFSCGPRAWGVQFHPEFDADAIRAYLDARRELLRAEGRDPDSLLAGVRESPCGPTLLRRFAALVLAGRGRC
jgi:GMP synthase (glutamine-hydrolysing)